MQPKTKKQVQLATAFLFAAMAPCVGLRAQSSTPPPANTTASTATPSPSAVSSSSSTEAGAENQKVTTLEKFTVSDVPVTEQILPTVRPISSVYGDDRDIIDIPRSVSSVNSAWMEDRDIKNAMDFGQFSPGVYSSANYGIPGVPQIRGDEAQIYVNGQLMPFSRNSTSLSFNGIEAMDIVKGPGTAVYGPQGNGPGGYVNFVPKQPYFDMMHVDFSVTLGSWTSGHSYGNPQYTLDFGGPINDKLAFRVSYNARYGDEYYQYAKDNTQDVYAALTYRMSHSVKLEWWVQGFATRTNEINGLNRVTQDGIWNGTYISGPTIVASTGPIAYYGYDVYLPGDGNPATNYPSGADGAYQIVDPTQAKVTKVPAYDALVGPNDTARSKLFQSQLKTTVDLTSTSSIVDLAYWALEHSNKFETYGYDEWVPRNLYLQDRLEYHGEFNMGPMVNDIITGLDYRYQYVRSGDDYTMEPFGYYDLSQYYGNLYFPGFSLEGNTWGSGLQIPGHPGYSWGEMQDTTLVDLGAFIQDDVKFTKNLSAILGFREDNIHANTANPPMTVVGENPNDPQGIYPYPFVTYYGYYAVTPVYLDRGALYNYAASVNDPSYFISFIYKLNDTQSLYATYDRVDAVRGQTNFGGVDNGYEGIDQLKSDMSTKSTLYEVGYKGSYLNNTLYGSVSLYQQQKLVPQLHGAPPNKVRTDGVELELVYQPSKRLSLNANLTYQDATSYGSFFEETGNYLDLYDPTTHVDGTVGTGYGAVNYGAYQGYAYTPPSGKIRAPGVPALMGNFFVDYKVGYGLGFGIGPNFIGHQNADDEGVLHIPSEYELDGYITYTPSRRWDVRLNIQNMTDQRVLDPIDVSFAGNDVIYVRPPVSASITFRLHY